jgi:hypothetical protein|tara:strand:+ start:100 stop:537 length:438 start_codon:yes stop_codon:yes gene_type:complete
MKYKNYDDIKKCAQYYNDNGYCGVISLAMAAGIGYGKAFHRLKAHGRKTGKGTPGIAMQLALKDFNLGATLCEKYGRAFKTLSAVRKNLNKLQGVYFIHSTTHVGCVRDGVYYDWAAMPNTQNQRNVRVFKITTYSDTHSRNAPW